MRIKSSKLSSAKVDDLPRKPAALLDPRTDSRWIGLGHDTRRLRCARRAAASGVDLLGRMEAEHRPARNADAVFRNCAQHKRTGRETRAVDDNPITGLPYARKHCKKTADLATRTRQDAEIRPHGQRAKHSH